MGLLALKKEELLREIVDNVGKVGRAGQDLRNVISVAMLSEGWDAKNVTHILGLRAFSSQLLCEQVIGRGLRRVGYGTESWIGPDGVEREVFAPEYVNVFGVPLSILRTWRTVASLRRRPGRAGRLSPWSAETNLKSDGPTSPGSRRSCGPSCPSTGPKWIVSSSIRHRSRSPPSWRPPSAPLLTSRSDLELLPETFRLTLAGVHLGRHGDRPGIDL